MNAHVAAAPVGGRLMTPSMRLVVGLFGIGALMIAWRLIAGLGATTAMNDGYPFGLWIAFDVVTGTALACGGYAVAILVYIRNKGQYSPLVRPAILTSALGYTLAGMGVALDVGRWWGLWKVPLFFWRWNFNSALLEIALCIMAYVVVLWIEIAPYLLERFKDGANQTMRSLANTAIPILKKTSIWIVALGMLLPTMHQSSLGTLMLLANWRLHELWRTPLVPLFFLMTCVSMGYAVVVFESAFSALGFKRKPETEMLAGLAGVIVPLQVVVVAMRLVDMGVRGVLGDLLVLDTRALMIILELALLLAPAVMLASPSSRRDIGHLVRSAMVMMFAGALYRFDVFLVAFNPGAHWSYFPSVPEILVTVGLIAAEVIAYVFIVRNFPILSGGRTVAPERQAA
ncbi:MAG: Ni/Fe-hydrogenase cytochrome b subunit [Acidobacteria bacterium]|nr:Ni/Fe-hydrogenase cytochrome b subunit [Acidobacteriota bacterium]